MVSISELSPPHQQGSWLKTTFTLTQIFCLPLILNALKTPPPQGYFLPFPHPLPPAPLLHPATLSSSATMYSIVQCSAFFVVYCSAIQWSICLHCSAVLCIYIWCNSMQCSAAILCTKHCCALQCSGLIYSAVLYNAVKYFTMPCSAVQYIALQWSTVWGCVWMSYRKSIAWR